MSSTRFWGQILGVCKAWTRSTILLALLLYFGHIFFPVSLFPLTYVVHGVLPSLDLPSSPVPSFQADPPER